MKYSCERPLVEGRDYLLIDSKMLRRTRNSQGILIGTARTNPGKNVSHPSHLDNPKAVEPLQAVYDALCSIHVDALVSIGGDDTLKTANKLKMFQDRFHDDRKPHLPIIHLPKTIDNDYMGIDFTFGYFTAVDTLANEIKNLLHDAEAGRAYFLTETMGRSAGWLAYGAAIAGEASLVISVEDVHGPYRLEEETVDSVSGETTVRPIVNMEALVKRIVKTMRVREEQEGKQYGVIVMAEGLAEYLPRERLEGIPRDDHGHISIAQVNLGKLLSKLVEEEFTRQTGRRRRVNGVQLGYEVRSPDPMPSM